jgi:NADH-quinone oxidoreductase subunit G
MAKIYVDNQPHEVDSSKNLLEVCLSEGYDLPYFCWHPDMGSVGACRQCAVKKYEDEDDTQGHIVMSCMEPAADGTRISIEDNEATDFRSSVIEWLMTNHPHDCPTCDEGGECHLQDMTVMTGHTYRRHRFNKRTFRNQYLGPCINHEMNRCIQCYRCVRFYRDYAGGNDFDAMASKNRVYFGRHKEGTLRSEFSGNLVEVCPTGVFTDKTLKKHYTRKWDFTTAPSICQQCSLGCNIIPGERYGELRRIQSRFNGKVNGYFICDRGRYGYEYVNDEERITAPKLSKGKPGKFDTVSPNKILEYIGKKVKDTEMIGIGSPRSSLETNFMLRKLVGTDNFYQGVDAQTHDLVNAALKNLQEGPARSPAMRETEDCDAILVLGEDLINTAPRLALSLRQAANSKAEDKAEEMQIPKWHAAAVQRAGQGEKHPVFIATPDYTKLDNIAEETYQAAPREIARLGFAIAHELNDSAPEVKNLNKDTKEKVKAIAKALKEADNPLIVSGTSLGSKPVVQAAANVAWALCEGEKQANLSYVVPEANSMGTAMIGGKSLDDAFEQVERGKAETAFILKNDLYERVARDKVDAFFDNVENLIVLDVLENKTTHQADAVVPVGTYAESDGTLVNNEGRAQRYYQVFQPDGNIQESWRWLRNILDQIDHEQTKDLNYLDDFTRALVKEIPAVKGVEDVAPSAEYRIAGQKIPRATHRYSGRTAEHAGESVHEPKPADDPDSPMSFTMEGYRGQPPSSNIPFFWSPGWNSQQAINKYQIEVGGGLHGGDPGVRLIEPQKNGKVEFHQEVPNKFQSKQGQWRVYPAHEIFGSETTSMYTEALQERAPKPYIVLSHEDQDKIKAKPDEKVKLTLHGEEIELPVIYSKLLQKGTAALPMGLKKIPSHANLPAWIKITKAK